MNLIGRLVGWLLIWVGALAATGHAQPPATPYALPDATTRPWTGDLDGMIQRRQIRILAPYSKTFYFTDWGAQRGLAYEIGRMFEDDLNQKLKNKNIRVHVVFVPLDRDQIIPSLLEGRGDIAIANLTITPERLKQVDFTEPTRRNVAEIVVTGPASAPIATAQALSGQAVYIRPSSSFRESLEQLNAEFVKAGEAPVKLRLAPEDLEIEDILEMVNAGLVKATIADDYVAEFWQKIFPKIVLNKDAAIRTGGEIGWMIRKDSPQLKAELNAFLARYPEGSAQRNQLLQKYWKNAKYVKDAVSQEERAKFERMATFFRQYGGQYGLDDLLMAAQGYQELRLDQNVKSKVGAIGVMQVMPATGQELQVGDIRQMEPNIHAGVKYIRFMMDRYYEKEPMDPLNKGLFTFAAYNAGPGRIAQLCKEAAKRGLNPNIWFNHVEQIATEKIGRETVTYVSNIYKLSSGDHKGRPYYILLRPTPPDHVGATLVVAPAPGSPCYDPFGRSGLVDSRRSSIMQLKCILDEAMYLPRTLEAAEQFPVLMVCGPRQVGKWPSCICRVCPSPRRRDGGSAHTIFTTLPQSRIRHRAGGLMEVFSWIWRGSLPALTTQPQLDRELFGTVNNSVITEDKPHYIGF